LTTSFNTRGVVRPLFLLSFLASFLLGSEGRGQALDRNVAASVLRGNLPPVRFDVPIGERIQLRSIVMAYEARGDGSLDPALKCLSEAGYVNIEEGRAGFYAVRPAAAASQIGELAQGPLGLTVLRYRVADRVLQGVAGIRRLDATTGLVQFEYQWGNFAPYFIGCMVRGYRPTSMSGSATLALFDDGWRVQSVQLR